MRIYHHWTVEAGMWATSVIEKKIREEMHLELKDINNWGSFSKIVFANAMFGSAGNAVTRAVAEPENFIMYVPNFVTNFRMEIPDLGVDETGTFQELFINEDALNQMSNSGGGYAYEQLLYGNRPYEKIINLKNPEGPKIFIIKESFALSVIPYLVLSCSEIVAADLRPTNGNFTGSVINCINQMKPDVVLVIQAAPQSLRLGNP